MGNGEITALAELFHEGNALKPTAEFVNRGIPCHRLDFGDPLGWPPCMQALLVLLPGALNRSQRSNTYQSMIRVMLFPSQVFKVDFSPARCSHRCPKNGKTASLS